MKKKNTLIPMATRKSIAVPDVQRYKRPTQASSRQITERKRAEEQFQSSEERLRLATAAAGLGTWHFDVVSGELIWSERCREIFAVPPERELNYGLFLEMVHPEDRERVDQKVAEAIQQRKLYEAEFRIFRMDGAVRWITALGRGYYDDAGNPTHMEGVVVDITERKQAEQETRRNLERIRAMHEINLAATSTLELRDILQRLLGKTEVFLPYCAATVRLYDGSTNSLEPVACRNLDEEEWKAAVRRGSLGLSKAVFETRSPLTVANLRTDARVRDSSFFVKQGLASYLALPMIVRGETLGVLGFYTKDAHEFSTEEIEFLSALAGQAAIAIQNSRLYQQTRRQAEELEKANNAKSEFLSVISHELRTPLNVVMGYTAMLRDGLLGEINPEQEEALAKVVRRSDELLRMIGTILDATSIEAGGVKVESHEISLTQFLDELRSSYDFPLDREVTVQWDYSAELPVIKSDREKLRHILQNLINNALKFTQKGSVTLSARITEDERQREGTRREAIGSRLTPHAFVEFTVADTGIGIPSDQVPVIFDMFRQADSSATRLHGGVGLGLYIVKKFAEMLGGTVEVESAVAKGSAFTVRIPC